jgi:hypothetical protein
VSDLMTSVFFSDMADNKIISLTERNYFGAEASRQYMSASQLKSFLDCPARTVAELSGEYQREDTTALLVGSFVDAYFAGELEEWKAERPNLYTAKGALRAEYQQAEQLIDLIKGDDLLRRMLSGSVQKIVTGEIAGVPFKGKIDSLLVGAQVRSIAEDYPEMAEDLLMSDGAIVDLKVMRDMAAVWVPGAGKVSFVQAWRYDLQCAIYQALIGRKLPCYLVVVTKERVPDKALIHIPQYMMDAALETVEPLIPTFQAYKAQPETAPRCEKCAYCVASKVITGSIDADDLEGAGL